MEHGIELVPLEACISIIKVDAQRTVSEHAGICDAIDDTNVETVLSQR